VRECPAAGRTIVGSGGNRSAGEDKGVQIMTRTGFCIAALALLAHPGMAAAMDPPGYAAPFKDTLETLNFPLLAELHIASGWAAAMRAEPALAALAADRSARIQTSSTAIADAWVWTTADIATAAAALRRIAARPGFAKALVADHMRPSGRFASHAALADADLLAAAWADTAAGLNNLIAVYAKGMQPRYPLIDASIFDASDPSFGDVLAAHSQVTVASARPDDLVFDPGERFAVGLLRMNERTDAAAYRPALAGSNAVAVAAAARTRWADYRYPALLVFGHGPDDVQSRTGVLGHIRMAMAADLFARKLAPFIIVSGGNVHPDRTPFNEAVEMRRILIVQHDIPAERIFIEPHARHTTTNLRNCARLLFAAGFPTDRPSLIVTDPMTAGYIGSRDLIQRAVAETGVSPGEVTASDTLFSFEFRPDRAAFQADFTDPLDP
jgi:hypothetical protein